MNKSIWISVLGIQNIGDGLQVVQTKTTGTYCFENGFHIVNYCELDEYGTATDNILFLTETEMQFNKSGSFAGRFKFLFGKKTLAECLTPFGIMIFEVETESYLLDVKIETIEVQLKYKLYAGDHLFLENNLSVHIEDSNIANIDLAGKY